jgi:hypothetical protein
MTANLVTKVPARTSKRDSLLKLLRSKRGATLAQMQKVTGWEPHSIRGFLSGTVKKKLGLKLRSEESKNGGRRYSIAAG